MNIKQFYLLLLDQFILTRLITILLKLCHQIETKKSQNMNILHNALYFKLLITVQICIPDSAA